MAEDKGISLKGFEIIVGFVWLHIEDFRQHMKTTILGPEGNGAELFATFAEAYFAEFQEYLEGCHEIEGTEAERFIDDLRRLG